MSRLSGCTATSLATPQVYCTKEDSRERRKHDPTVRLRNRLEKTDGEFDELDREVHEIVEAALQFAQNGTDSATRRSPRSRTSWRSR